MPENEKQLYLPFKLTKEEAVEKMVEFIKKEDPKDKTWIARSISAPRIYGSYIPLAVIDANAHARFYGTAEIETGTYDRLDTNGDDKVSRGSRVCSVKRWQVERIFDIEVKDMLLNLNTKQSRKRASLANMIDNQNIVNEAAPFDFENAQEWNPEDVKDVKIETVDYDESKVDQLAVIRLRDVARHSIIDTISQYDRGAYWNLQLVEVKDKAIKYIYCPVWIFPMNSGSSGSLKRYIVVNARNGKTTGNPAIMEKDTFQYTYGTAIGIFLMACFIAMFAGSGGFLLVMCFVIPFAIIWGTIESWGYLKLDVRHYHEKDTKHKVSNLKMSDVYLGEFHDQPVIPDSNSDSIES